MTNVYVDETDEGIVQRFRIVGMRRDGRIFSGRYRDVVVKTDEGWHVTAACSPRRRTRRLRSREATVDLRAHDAAFGRGMVVATEQRSREHVAGAFSCAISSSSASSRHRRDRLPLLDRRGGEDPVDLVERKPGVLQHADEHESTQRLRRVPALTGRRASASNRPRRS